MGRRTKAQYLLTFFIRGGGKGERGRIAQGLHKNLVPRFVHAATLLVNKLSHGRVLLSSKFQHNYPHLVDLKTETKSSVIGIAPTRTEQALRQACHWTPEPKPQALSKS